MRDQMHLWHSAIEGHWLATPVAVEGNRITWMRPAYAPAADLGLDLSGLDIRAEYVLRLDDDGAIARPVKRARWRLGVWRVAQTAPVIRLHRVSGGR